MRPKAPDRMDVIKKEDKEARLAQFITKHLEARKAASAGGLDDEFLLVLRSAESPVARAISALAGDIRAAGISVRVVLAQISAATIDRDVAAISGFAGRIGIMRDFRLLDAHEQLVLGPATVWVGDCMRREPAKRDAFELYAADCAESARCAQRSFARIWQHTEAAVAAITVLPEQRERDEIDPGLVPPPDEQAAVEASTRH